MKYQIEISGYRYAPEQTRIKVYGKPFANMDMRSQLAHDAGYLLICGKEKEAFDLVKKEIRKLFKKKNYVTIGFMEEGKNLYHFTKQLMADNEDLGDKLRVFKEFKRFCQSQNCKLKTVQVTSFDVTPYGTGNRKTEELISRVDLNRPVKIKL